MDPVHEFEILLKTWRNHLESSSTGPDDRFNIGVSACADALEQTIHRARLRLVAEEEK